jgi:signal transduction histidine kinase
MATERIAAPADTVFSPIFGVAKRWLQPVSTERDLAFRERILRVTLLIIIVLGLISFALTIFVYQSEFALVSFYSMHLVALAGCFTAAWAVSRQRIFTAGMLLTGTVLFASTLLFILARQEASLTGLISGIPSMMFVPLVATLVLPRSMILGTSALTAAVYALALFVPSIGGLTIVDLNVTQVLTTAVPILLIEGVLLRQLRVEFDDRLDTMRLSIQQAELAKRDEEFARQRAEESDKAKSQFLASMSHELRTPLNAIIGYDEAMLAGMAGTFTPKQTELLQRIQANSRRLLALINDVLDLSKIESGSVEVYLVPISPRKVIADSVENLRSLAIGKSLSLVVEIDEDVPELVLGDTNKIQQIAVNLIGNAIKFTPKGDVTVTVSASEGDLWQFSVQDTGIGISDAMLPHLFEPFRQDSLPEVQNQKGTGLGLAISKRLAEAMGGTITVSTQVGKGSVFTVMLPRATMPEVAKMIA